VAWGSARPSRQVFLDETWAEVDVDLNEWLVADAAEAVNLARLHHENVAGACLEFFAVYVPEASAFANDLDFIIRMAMRSWTATGLRAEEKHGDVHVAVFGTHELM